jgi:hypothetical protein
VTIGTGTGPSTFFTTTQKTDLGVEAGVTLDGLEWGHYLLTTLGWYRKFVLVRANSILSCPGAWFVVKQYTDSTDDGKLAIRNGEPMCRVRDVAPLGKMFSYDAPPFVVRFRVSRRWTSTSSTCAVSCVSLSLWQTLPTWWYAFRRYCVNWDLL